MHILAFAASNSSLSINKQLVNHAAAVVQAEILNEAAVRVLELHDFEMPLYRHDREVADGIPDLARQFREAIAEADAVLVSFAEHNGSYTAAYKNIFDWASRLEGKVWAGKPLVFLSTSPGGRGGQSVLAAATGGARHFGGDVKASLSVPSFYQNFDSEAGILTDPDLAQKLREALTALVTEG